MIWNFNSLQQEQKPWVAHNFGDRPSWQPLLGIIEEQGEMFEAFASNSEPDMKDALADIAIFMCDFCSAMDFEMQPLYVSAVDMVSGPRPLVPIGIRTGNLAHSYLKKAQGIRGSVDEHNAAMRLALTGILAHMVVAANGRGWDLLMLAHDTWQKVKRRDWKANALTGASP